MIGPDRKPDKPGPESLAAGHETAEVPAKPVVNFVIGVTVLVVVSGILMALLFGYFARRETAQSPKLTPLEAANRGRMPPEPRLQTDPLKDYQMFRAWEDSVLSSYGWVDRDSAVVRIPVALAMQIVARQGLPARRGPARASEPDLRLEPPMTPVEPAAPASGTRGGSHHAPAAPIEPVTDHAPGGADPAPLPPHQPAPGGPEGSR